MHNKQKNIFKILAIFLILAAVIISSKNIANPFRIEFTDFIAPLLKTFNSAITVSKKIIPFSSLREENSILRDRIDLLNRKLEESKVLYNENQRLKDLLNFRKIIPYTTMPGQVIGRDPSNWSNSVIIDKGLNYGIKKGKVVLSTRGLVGRVVEVGRYSSKILLISDPNSKVGTLIQRNRAGGILIGTSDGKCKLTYLSLDSDVAIGDRVITAGFGTIFPKDILIGQVIRVDKEPGRLYKYAIVKPSQDLSKVEEVLCIK